MEPWRPPLRAVFTRKSARDRGRPLLLLAIALCPGIKLVAEQLSRYQEDTEEGKGPKLPLKGGGRGGGIVNRSSTIETMSRIREIGFNERVNGGREGENEGRFVRSSKEEYFSGWLTSV